MHLWLRDTPGQRTLILLTSTEDESRGLPPRALVFRPGRGSQAIVEFLRKSDVDRDGLIKLSSRPVEGCLGLINVEGGMIGRFAAREFSNANLSVNGTRHFPHRGQLCNGCG